MGKTPKKAAPGGDERNLYVRRLKATTSLSSKACDTNLTVKQRESDNSNRAKAVGVQKRLPVPVTKVFKSKLRSPTRSKSRQALKNPTRFQPATSKDEEKNLASTATSQNTELTTMYTESEESAVQLKVSITKKEVAEEDGKSVSQEETVKSEEETSASPVNFNGKETTVELTEAENTTSRAQTPRETKLLDAEVEKSTTEESSIGKFENGDESSETIKSEDEKEAKEEIEAGGCESDENSLKLVDEPEVPKSSNEEKSERATNERSEEEEEEKREEARETRCEKETPPITTDNRSADDVVESTTSEISSSARGGTQSDKESETRDEEAKESRASSVNDTSFVSYDSSIMLKDVQIKLNDCLKENSKLFEVSNVEEPQRRLDMSFGKTLRNISGRSTINRLRYVTVREHRFSPNSSLFVNTSSASLDPDDTASNKLLRYPTDIADSIIHNGSPLERKRKIADNAAASTKKFKSDASSLLDTSLEMLKSIRRPVEVSTPNNRGYNFQSDKFDYKTFNDEKLPIDGNVEPKKWCVVM